MTIKDVITIIKDEGLVSVLCSGKKKKEITRHHSF